MLGLLLTLWIVQQSQGAGVLLQEATFRKLVLWSLIPAFLGVALLAAGARDIPSSTSTRATPGMGVRGLGRGFAAFAACSVLFEIGNSADAFLVLRAQERGVSVVGVLWMLLAFNVVYAVVSTPASSVVGKHVRRRLPTGRRPRDAVPLGVADEHVGSLPGVRTVVKVSRVVRPQHRDRPVAAVHRRD